MTSQNDNPKNILMLACVDVSLGNACTLHISGIANGFVDLGHAVTLVVPEPDDEKKSQLKLRENVTVHYFKSCNNIPNAFKIFFAVPQLIKEFNKKPDLFYTRFSLLNALSLGLCKIWRIPSVSEHNGLIGEEVAILGQTKLMAPVAHGLQILDGWMANKVSAVTTGLKQLLNKSYVPNSKIFVSGNGTDTTIFKPMDRAECLTGFGLNPDRNYIGFIGVLAEWQGISCLIDALARLQNTHPDWDILIAGAGPQRAELGCQAEALGLKNRVHFAGQISIDLAPKIINCFDIATSPALHRHNAAIGVATVKIRDYAATGRAILAARLPGNAELEQEGILLCHEAENIDDLAQQISNLIDNSMATSRDEYGRRALDYAKLKFDWKRYSAQALEETI